MLGRNVLHNERRRVLIDAAEDLVPLLPFLFHTKRAKDKTMKTIECEKEADGREN